MASVAQTRYRARVAARAARGSRGSRIQWDRLGRIVLVLVLLAVVASYISPTLHVFQSWRESKSAAARLTELRQENAELTRKAKSLESDAAVMAEARKLGLVAPGEQPYVVDGVR